ncbi:MAG TPA: Flp family type IVb pilin [Acidocella sp.]|nr:Flp family type IVb pilin [Acidocella sp.]
MRRRPARDEKFLADVTAVSAIEYALLAALISMIIIYAISQIGSVLNIVF